MARAGFCDSKPLLDLHNKEKRLSAQATDDISGGFLGDSQAASVDRRADRQLCVAEKPSLFHLPGLQGLPSLQAWMPNLLRREVELSLEKLDLIWDHTYAWDMFLDMMRCQAQNCLSSSDLLLHFTDSTRVVLVDWLIQVHDIMSFQADTLHLAIHLLNQSLCKIKVTTTNLQLLGMVCLFLAAKKEESHFPEVSSLCFLMDHTYTKHQLLRMERRVLCALMFNLSYCSPLNFVLIFASIAQCSAMVVWMARYLLELSLLEGQCVVFSPMQLAGASLCLARQVLQEPLTPDGEAAWYLASSVYVGSEAVLLRAMHILATAASNASSQDNCAPYIKFSSPEAMYVSRHPRLKNASTLLAMGTFLSLPKSFIQFENK